MMESLQHRGTPGQTLEYTEDTTRSSRATMLVQIEEDKGGLRKLSFVTKLSCVLAIKDMTQGFGVCLSDVLWCQRT